LANFASTGAFSAAVRSLSRSGAEPGNSSFAFALGTTPATASPKLNQLVPWRSAWSNRKPFCGHVTSNTPKS